MNATLLYPALAALVGALIWGMAGDKRPKLTEAGKLTFFVGIFWLVYVLSSKTLHLGI